MLAIGLSLAACLGWGVADYLGGIKSRQLSAPFLLSCTAPVMSIPIGLH